MKAALIVNPFAGQGRTKKNLLRVQNKLKSAGFDLTVFVTEKENQATEFAAQAVKNGNQIIIALGGDGTVSEAVNGIAGSKAKQGLIPGGTGDVFAREMEIPTHNVLRACDIIIRGKTRKIDLGKANGRYFVLMAGVGFDARVISEIKPEMKRWLKDLAYPLTGIKTLFTYKPTLLRIKLDNEIAQGYFAVIGNARYYGGRFSVAKEAQIDDGLLDVCVFHKKSVASFIRYFQGVIIGSHLKMADVSYYRARDIEITSEEPVLVQADGDVIDQTPMGFRALPRVLDVLVP